RLGALRAFLALAPVLGGSLGARRGFLAVLGIGLHLGALALLDLGLHAGLDLGLGIGTELLLLHDACRRLGLGALLGLGARLLLGFRLSPRLRHRQLGLARDLLGLGARFLRGLRVAAAGELARPGLGLLARLV